MLLPLRAENISSHAYQTGSDEHHCPLVGESLPPPHPLGKLMSIVMIKQVRVMFYAPWMGWSIANWSSVLETLSGCLLFMVD